MMSASCNDGVEKSGPFGPKDIAPPSGLSKYALDFLDAVSYRLMSSDDDLEQVFRMRHDAYKAANHIAGNETGIWTDEADRCPSASLVGVFVDGELAASVRLHRLESLSAQSTAVEVFSDILRPRFEEGMAFSDTNRLSCDLRFLQKFKALPLATIRVTGLHVAFYGCSYSLAAVRRQHEPFYKRVLGTKRWSEGDGVNYKGTTAYLHLLAASSVELRDRCFRDRQYFLSTPEERRALFGGAAALEHVRPSARQVLDGADTGYWSREEN